MSPTVVLCYHAVSERWDAPLSITPANLEAQVTFLLRHGWRPVTFTEAVLDSGSDKTVALTFDDAYTSVLKLALPVLDRLGAVATVFAPTAYVSDGRPVAWPGVDHWEQTEHAAELATMRWDDLRLLAGRGWEVGSHTVSHPRLTSLSDDALACELRDSKVACEGQLRLPCESLAYPYGDVDPRVARAARETGYRAGARLSSDQSGSDPYLWPRIGVYHADSWWRFRLKMAAPMRALRASSLWPRR